MYKFIKKAISSASYLKSNNQPLVRAIDAVSEDFVINKYGHIRSDFAVLTDTTSNLEFARALANMQAQYQSDSSQFDGMTFEQMVKAVRPRWCQLPGEVDRFEQYLIDQALDFYNKLRADEKSMLEEEDAESAVPNNPATLGGTTQPSE